MTEVGYTEAYANSYCGKMWENKALIEEIDRIDAETEEKADMSRDALVKSQMDIVNTGTNSEKTRAASLVADMMGYKRDKAPNAEREQAIRQKMTDEELVLHKEIARLRTQQESIRLVQDKRHA